MSQESNFDPNKLIVNWNNQLGKIYQEAEETLYPILLSLKQAGSRYTLNTKLGEGGEKTVERVYDQHTARFIALAKPIKKSTQDYEHFLREARLLTSLQHPNIIPVYDIGLIGNEPFFTMEWVQEGNLKDLLKSTKPIKLEIFLQVCDAIAFAHSKGVLNLDIKPENIHIGLFSKVLVLDWGLAQMWREKSISGTFRIKGTPGFIAPEQLAPKQNLGRFTDIYQLGALLFCMLYKKIPIEGDSVDQIFRRTLAGEVSLIEKSKTHARLNSIISKAMSKNPTDRYQSVLDLKKDVQLYCDGFPTQAEQASFLTHLRLLYQRHRLICNLTFFFSLLISTAALLFIEKVKSSETRAQVDRQKAEDLLSLYENAKKYRVEMEAGIINSIESILATEQNPETRHKILLAPTFRLFNSHNYEAAVNYTLEVLKYQPNSENAWLFMGYLHFIRFDFELASKAFSKSGDDNWSKELLKLSLKYQELFPNKKLHIGDIIKLLQEPVKYKHWDWLKFHIICSHHYHHPIKRHLELIEALLLTLNPRATIQIKYSMEDNGAILNLEGSTGIETIIIFEPNRTILDSLELHELHLHGMAPIKGTQYLDSQGVFIIK